MRSPVFTPSATSRCSADPCQRHKTLICLAALGCVLGLAVSATGAYAYPRVKIENRTEYTLHGEVEYASAFCSDDKYSVAAGSTWRGPDRGVCLVTGITGKLSGTPASLAGSGQSSLGDRRSVVPYDSTGTGYSQFLAAAYGGSYRIFSRQEYASVSDTRPGKSPGFRFVNKTAWPVAYSLDQVGCLHHGIVPTGARGQDGVLNVHTGAVWFTLRAHIQPDGINPQSDWDCVEPVAELVGDVALAAISAGVSGPVAVGAKVVVKTVVKAAIKEAAKSVATSLAKDLAEEELGKLLTEGGSVTLYGQYAGYEWPFRCDRMPEYHITGGPIALRDNEGNEYLQQSEPFTVTKMNSCGDDMMRASKRSATADDSVLADILGGGDDTTSSSSASASASQQSALITDGAYFWVLNGDGSRNFLSSRPSCRQSATTLPRAQIDRIPKRHDGYNASGYQLDGADVRNICSNPSGAPARLLTNGTYFWVVNADGSRNWIDSGSVDSNCRRNASRTSNIESYPKRHNGGNDSGYALRGADAQRACRL